MLYVIFAVVALLVVLITTAVAIVGRNGGAAAIAAVAFVLLLLVTGFASFTKVDARAVAIQTSFGQYRDTIQSGAHMLSPWSEVEEFSTLAQPLDLSDLDDSKGNAVSVAFAGTDKNSSGGNGIVNAVVRWRINPAKAEDLWKKYKTFDTVRDSLVLSEAQDAFREVIGQYAPNAARAGANIRPISDAVKTGLGARLVDDGILIDSVSIKGVQLDAATAKSLERTVIANNNVATALAEQERAKIDADTAKLREREGALTPAAQVRYCLEVVNAWDVQKNGPLPATFNCGMGGPGASILVGAK
jgi:regulator of protease activity HflC (stomatin/prohibitin superfamily)